MQHWFNRISIVTTLASTLALVACGKDDDPESTPRNTGGSAAMGGEENGGMDEGTGGSTGGTPATGGSGNEGGTDESTGGSTGGAPPNTGGMGNEGGTDEGSGGSTGGTPPTTGGTPPEGGAETGGMTVGGADPGTGGSSAGAPVDGGAGGVPTVQGGEGGGTSAEGGAAGSTGTDDPNIIELADAAGSFTTLLAAVEAAELTAALEGDGPLTVFAPTDEAFEAFEAANPGVLASLSQEELAAILTYHVVAGEVLSTDLVSGSLVTTLNGARVAVDLTDGVMIDGAEVVQADLAASNGVIHVIDTVMLPPSSDIVETAVAAGTFTTLAGALVATGLDEALSGDGPFTVFAPTDDAFAAFEEENPGVLASLTNEELTDILLYHVVSGWAGPADLSDGLEVPTLLTDATVTITIDGGVQVNDATVTTANIVTTNGVIHVIDTVLLPPSG